jgi:hypothetical protein
MSERIVWEAQAIQEYRLNAAIDFATEGMIDFVQSRGVALLPG